MSNWSPANLKIRSIIRWRVFIFNVISLFVASHDTGSVILDILSPKGAISVLELISFESQLLPMICLVVEASHIPVGKDELTFMVNIISELWDVSVLPQPYHRSC
jgi:hypothetical protein